MSLTWVGGRSAVAFAVLSVLSAAAVAQQSATSGTALEEVVVTAQKRAESLQDVPVAVSAVAGDKLAESGITRIEDLKTLVPSFFMTETAIGNNIAIRGIFSGVNPGFEQSVGTYVDGIYRGRPQQTRAPFFDLERLEVLRGSQSILFGKNSVAGALNVTTARPTKEAEGMASVLYEPDNNDQEYTLVLSGPLNDRLRGRVAGRYRTIDGHLKNLTNNRDEPERSETNGRAWLEFDATDTLTLSLKAEVGEFDVKGRQIEIATEVPGAGRPTYAQILAGLTGDATLLNNYLDYNRTSNAGDKSDNDTEEYAFNIDWKLGDYTLTAITGYSKYDFQELCDCDFTGANVFTIDIAEKFDQTSQEIRLASPTGGRFDFIVGGYYETADLEYRDGIKINSTSLLIPIVNQLSPGAGTALTNVGAPRLFLQDSESYAVFAQGGWKMTDSLHLTAGLRWTHEEKDASRDFRITDINGNPLQGAQAVVTPIVFATVFNGRAHSLAGSRSEDKVLPSVTLEWHSQEQGVLTYLHYGEGAKSGGYDARGNNPTVPPATGCITPPVTGQPRNPPGCLYGREIGTFEFQDEEAENYELGLKSRIGDSAEVNVAVYYTDFKNLQVSTFDGSLGFNVRNAGKATVQGVEIEGRWRASENLLFSGAVTYTDFEFKDYVGQCYFGQTPNAPDGLNCDYSGQPNQFVADWVGMLSAEYRHPIGESLQFRLVLDGYYTSEYFAAPTLDPKQVVDSYFRLNGRVSIGADDGKWEIALIGKNLTDELIAPYGNDTPLSATVSRGFSAWRFVEPARTIALQATYRL